MKTVAITCCHQLISRNILASPVLDLLLSRGDIRVVVFFMGNEVRRSFLEHEFVPRGIAIDGIPRGTTKGEKFLKYLSLAALDTKALAIKRKADLGSLSRLMGESAVGRSLAHIVLRLTDGLLTPAYTTKEFFDRHNPDLLFATDVQNEYDIRFMHEAKHRGISVAGMVRSWDNLTSKGLMRVLPDLLLVNNEVVRDEAIRYNGVPAERIRVVGIPHYDRYLTEKRRNREEFFKRIGGDPSKRLILFAPLGDRYLASPEVNRELLEIIFECLAPDAQILVRLPPHYLATLEGFSKSSRIIFERITTPYAINPRKVELSLEEDRHLADTLHYSDVVVTGPSTIAIDASLFNRPVVLACFDGRKTPPYERSIKRYYDYEHMQPILASGGVKVATNADELKMFVNDYLKNPRLNQEGRKRIAEEQCFKLDGQSGWRMADALIDAAGRRPIGHD